MVEDQRDQGPPAGSLEPSPERHGLHPAAQLRLGAGRRNGAGRDVARDGGLKPALKRFAAPEEPLQRPTQDARDARPLAAQKGQRPADLDGGHDFTSPEHRAKVAGVLGIDPGVIPDRPSWAYDQIVEGIRRGTIKGLWVVATNPAHSWINQSFLRQILDNLELLVVQDMYSTTETAELAHLVLPAAGWGEKDGTFINSERRIGVVKKVARAPGQALADFWIFKALADAWGCGHLFEAWSSPEATFRILTELSRGQPCDITGVTDYRMIDAAGGIQWPYPEGTGAVPAERRLFEDRRFHHPDGRARFRFEDPAPAPEPTSPRYPFILLTGRGTTAQWHTGTRTDKSAMLRALAPAHPHVELSPHDAGALGLEPDEAVVIESRRGKMRARVFVTPTVQPGQVFVPMHLATTNLLTAPVFDPYSRQPGYKHCAVNVRRPDLGER